MKLSETSPELAKKAANTIRILSAEGVQKAKSGHPGLPMGMADCAFVLWSRFMQFNPKDPNWLGRDRFVLSAGHGSMLLYSMLHLAGYDVSLEDLKSFRQWDSRTPGHPEVRCLPGVETTTGPLGQGFTNGVGMAIAAKITASRYNTSTDKLFGQHQIFGIVSDGDLMEGVSSEAASLAAHLKLDNIVYIYDDNKITIDGSTELAFSEDVQKRFEAYGWKTTKIDGHNHEEIAHALSEGVSETERPTLIIARTHIGYGSPNKQDTAGVHGAPLGDEELELTKKNLGWNETEAFRVPPDVKTIFENRNAESLPVYNQWQERFEGWRRSNPDLAQEMENAFMKILPEGLEEELISTITEDPAASRAMSGALIQKLAGLIPSLYGGSADLAPSNNTMIKSSNKINARDFSGRNFHFGIREHAMAGIMNGMALYGGLIPYGGTFLVFSDYMRPAIRLASIMEQQVIYVFTHDSIFVGEDGPTHQPVEHISALRCIPNLLVLRPGNYEEVAMSWATALRRKTGPSALILTRQKLEPVRCEEDHTRQSFDRGGYIFQSEKGTSIDLILIGSGSELSLAVDAAHILQQEDLLSVRVISMPSLDRYLQQNDEYRNNVVAPSAKGVLIIEAGVSFGWGAVTRSPYQVVSMNRYGASAPYKILAEKFGFSLENVVARARLFMAELS